MFFKGTCSDDGEIIEFEIIQEFWDETISKNED